MKKLSTLRKKADKLLQEKCVSDNPRCLICNDYTSECHHFVQKSQSRVLRYDPDNLIPLCKGCHFKIHRWGDAAIIKKIIDIKGEKWFDQLQEKRHQICKENKSFYQKIIKRLEDR